MTTETLERDLRAWFAEVAPQTGELEEAILLETSALSQRPRWLYRAPLPHPMRGSVQVALAPRRTQVALLLVVLGLLVATAAAWVGSRQRLPAPFGQAANGLVAYEKAGDIFVVDPATGARRAIALGPDLDQYPRWSRDGTRLAFLRGGESAQLVVVDPDGTVVSTTHGEPLTAMDPDGIEWSPDGRHIALAKVGRIELVDVETGDVTPLPSVQYDGLGIQWRPPDGRELTFLASEYGRRYLVRLDIESGGAEWLPLAAETQLGASLRPIGWTPDGRRFAYHVNDFASRETRVMTLGTRDEVVLPVAFGRISNDGTRIVGLRTDGEPAGLCVAPTAGGLCQPIQGDPALVDLAGSASFQWAPDDRSIWTDPAGQSGSARLLDPDGGPVQDPAWAAEGADSWQRRSP